MDKLAYGGLALAGVILVWIANSAAFIDAKAFAYVILMTGALALVASRNKSGSAFWEHTGRAAALAGWVGFLMGVVMISSAYAAQPELTAAQIFAALSIAFLTPLYGHVLQFMTMIVSAGLKD